MLRIKKVISLIFAILICMSLNSCKSKSSQKKETKEKNINVYIDIKDKNSLSIIKFLTEEYKKENPKVNLKINDVLGGNVNITEDISKGSQADMLFTSRNTMVELSQKGLISDIGQYYEKNKIGEKYYNIVSSYGRVGEKYYGVPLMPYTIEVFYNAEALNKLGIPQPTNIKDMVNILKKTNANNIRIPVVLPEDLDINTALSSVVVSNMVKLSDLDNMYDNKNSYKNIKEMQGVFEVINSVSKELGVTKNTFEIGNESSFTSLVNGSIPIIISTSYYYNNVKEGKVGIIEDYSMLNNQKGVTPIIVNAIICMPANVQNSEEVGNFIKYILDEKTQEKLVKKGFVTANRKSNEKLSGIGASIDKHLLGSNDNSIVYIYNLPKKFQGAISSKIDSILSGKYTGSEWVDIINEIYK